MANRCGADLGGAQRSDTPDQPAAPSKREGSALEGGKGGCDPAAGRPEGGGSGRAQRGPTVPAGLPCQNCNNSNKSPKKYRLKPIPNAPGFFVAPSGRIGDVTV
jgi:hypothetical protein